MAIQVSCGQCGKVFRVKDELAGRRFRCSECQAAVTVPKAETDDPWELSDEDYGEAIPKEEEEVSRPAPRKKKKVSRRSRSSDGMPASVMIAMGCTGLTLCLVALAILGSIIDPVQRKNIFIFLIRLGINIRILTGLMNRESSYRTGSIVLSVLGLLMIGCAVSVASDRLGDGFERQVAMTILVIQGTLWITNIVALLTPSASEWCSE